MARPSSCTLVYVVLLTNTIAVPRVIVREEKLGLTYSQIPIRTRDALMVHFSRSQTFPNGIIVDCKWGQRLAYAAASRAVTLVNVAFCSP